MNLQQVSEEDLQNELLASGIQEKVNPGLGRGLQSDGYGREKGVGKGVAKTGFSRPRAHSYTNFPKSGVLCM